MTTEHPLTVDLAKASASLNRCKCGSKCIMRYEPGCTFIFCLAEKSTKLASPDWNPQKLSEKWNKQNTKP